MMLTLASPRGADGSSVTRNLPLALAAAVALVAGSIAALSAASLATAAVAVGLALVVVVAAAPAVGAYAWLLLCPLIVGIPRGEGLLVMRPNEALLLLLVAGLGMRVLWRLARRERFVPPLERIDVSVGLLVLTGSIMPLLLRYGRGLPLSQDDFLYALVFVKYLILYAFFRLAITNEAEVGNCLKFALVAGTLVAAVALLQVADVSAVIRLLSDYYDSPFTGSTGAGSLRGSSTVASSFGLADSMAISFAVVLAWQGKHRLGYLLLLPAGLLFLGGCIAAGSFSGVIGLGVVVLAVGLVTGRLLAQLAIILPTTLAAAAVFWPVVAARLAGFQSYEGLPHSWIGRLQNLQRFFWPELFSGLNWLVGVRPAARVAAPEGWRDWVYIESGHTWLLWSGGVPLLLAFLFFSFVVLRDLYETATSDRGPVAIAAASGFAAMALIFVLTLFDPHLTVRGTADLFFPFLALALVATGLRRPACLDFGASARPVSLLEERR